MTDKAYHVPRDPGSGFTADVTDLAEVPLKTLRLRIGMKPQNQTEQ